MCPRFLCFGARLLVCLANAFCHCYLLSLDFAELCSRSCNPKVLPHRMSGSLRFYIDGALAYERLGVVVNTSTLPLQFAGHVSDEFPGGANASDGYLELDEIRFYNLPLSSEDVLALANASDGGIADRSQAPGAPIGIAIAETSNPAVFTVEQGSFASAPIPPRFHIEGGQWRRTNRGGLANV